MRSIFSAAALAFLLSPFAVLAQQNEIVQLPEGGKLDALDDQGAILGPCPLKHTDVEVSIAGHFTRVTLRQQYHNPYDEKIEAVYTFPMSHRSAVDRMRMIIGDRIVDGDVKERDEARQIYEAARHAGHIASLLEQERPNIFTQSVANIEPNAQIVIEISYIETLEPKDGEYTFVFPMVVGPRYIPGSSTVSPALVPAELELRRGVILLGPAKLEVGEQGVTAALGTLQTGKLHALFSAAQPIKHPGVSFWDKDEDGNKKWPQHWYSFSATYTDGSQELGQLYVDGTGHLNNRWFFTDPDVIKEMGTGFTQNTNQVPDASRITPEPVKPGTRAGHDISVSVTIDTGGPTITKLNSDLHEIEFGNEPRAEFGSKIALQLADKKDIPNRDFVLRWRLKRDALEEAILTHAPEDGNHDNFVTLILNPPDRVEPKEIRPRELIFVMDTSGSMRGFPIKKSKQVMRQAIDSMRELDTFNLITFAGHTQILWDESKFATRNNREQALQLVDQQRGSGGTEMMKAIDAALVQTIRNDGGKDAPITPEELATLPADGRRVKVLIPYTQIRDKLGVGGTGNFAGAHEIIVRGKPAIVMHMHGVQLPSVLQPEGISVLVGARWETTQVGPMLLADSAAIPTADNAAVEPMRIVIFLTDGYVGNDMAIIDAIRKNADTTRVFSFGIGNSVNRFLLDGMAAAGRGESEFVLLTSDADEAVKRFARRIQTPVLTDISLEFSDGLDVVDVTPGANIGEIPDLFDVKPLVIHARYGKAGSGTVTIRGRTATGAFERIVAVDLPEQNEAHDQLPALWARAKIGSLMNQNLAAVQQGSIDASIKAQIVDLGVTYNIMSQYTSFVAVEKSRVTIGGKPLLVPVPIEMPQGVSYEGIFGDDGQAVRGVGGGLVLGLQPLGRRADRLRAIASSGGSAQALIAGIRGGGQPMLSGGGQGRGQLRFSRNVRMTSASSRSRRPTRPGGGGVAIGGGAPARTARPPAPPRTEVALREFLNEFEIARGFDESGQTAKSLAGWITKKILNGGDKNPRNVLESIFGDADQRFFIERLSITINEFLQHDEADAAHAITKMLVAWKPDHATVRALNSALPSSSEDVSADEQKERTAKVAVESRATIEAFLESPLREYKLRHRLDDALESFALGQGFPETLVQIYHGPVPLGSMWQDGGIAVSILFDELDDADIQSIEALGLKVLNRVDTSRFVVAACPLGRFDDVALLDDVRRVELVRE